MKRHILLEKAFIYPISKEKPDMSKYVFSKKGYWVSAEGEKPLILDSKWAKPRTKKNDLETGEDLKGA